MSSGLQSRLPSGRTLLSAKIIFNDRCSVFDCMVRSLSTTEAVLEMPSTLGVPALFHLRIAPSQLEYFCEIAWRTENRLGVTLTQRPHAHQLPVVPETRRRPMGARFRP